MPASSTTQVATTRPTRPAAADGRDEARRRAAASPAPVRVALHRTVHGDVYSGEGVLRRPTGLDWVRALWATHLWWVEPQGAGTLLLRAGPIVVGHFAKGVAAGRVTVHMFGGTRIEGHVRGDAWVGAIELTRPDRSVYRGGIRSPHPFTTLSRRVLLSGGTFTGPRGGRESGDFVPAVGPRAGLLEAGGPRWCLQGWGLRVQPDRGRLEGRFRGGEVHGLGREETPDGGVYVGTYQGGVRHGPGGLTFADGSGFVGRFEAGEPNPSCPFLPATHLPGPSHRCLHLADDLLLGQRWGDLADLAAARERFFPGSSKGRDAGPTPSDAGRPAPTPPESDPAAAALALGSLEAWQPRPAWLRAIAELTRDLLSSRLGEDLDTRRLLASTAHLLGPARRFFLATPSGQWRLGAVAPARPYASMLDFVADAIGVGHQVKLAFGNQLADCDDAYILFHAESHREPRRRLKSLMEEFAAGLTLAWQADQARGDGAPRLAPQLVAGLSAHGPCLDGRLIALGEGLVALGLVADAARAVADRPDRPDPQATVMAEVAAFRASMLDRARRAEPALDAMADFEVAEQPSFTRKYFTPARFAAHMSGTDFLDHHAPAELAAQLEFLRELAIF